MFATKMLASNWGSLKTQKTLCWTTYAILATVKHKNCKKSIRGCRDGSQPSVTPVHGDLRIQSDLQVTTRYKGCTDICGSKML